MVVKSSYEGNKREGFNSTPIIPIKEEIFNEQGTTR
jgi:hypothetical protein